MPRLGRIEPRRVVFVIPELGLGGARLCLDDPEKNFGKKADMVQAQS